MNEDQLAQARQAMAYRRELATATQRLTQAVLLRQAPAQADITAARTTLEQLIELAGGDQ